MPNQCNDIKKVVPQFWQLIQECWDDNPTKRPSAQAIVNRLEQIDFEIEEASEIGPV